MQVISMSEKAFYTIILYFTAETGACSYEVYV